ncbi:MULTISPECIES: hypothetical protein [unclassified Bacillus cereus group]|uniref:hypothetical protein n=1 Tax=unclassified Bacillus cereus group TaxID=2750818 RepID=UPI0015D0DF18|nr:MULTISPECIES: hypothetical protein [unclassified Bacillus cereus group]
MSEKKDASLKSLQEEILKKFKAIGIEGQVGRPHLQRDNASLIIPNEGKENKFILK